MAALEWSNWSGGVRCEPRAIRKPVSEAEICACVREAADAGVPVRSVGSGHSFSAVAPTDGILLSLVDFAGLESFDEATRRAWVRAGTVIHDIGDTLREHGGALANQGDIDVQSFGGAIATGTHGTGPSLGNMCTRVVAVRTAAADGSVQTWSEDGGPGPLEAIRVSLGMLGLATAFQIQLDPPYRLLERTWREDFAPCMDRLGERIAATRHFEFFWWPREDVCEMKALDPTEEPIRPSERPGEPGERVDWSYRIFPSVRELRFNEMEYAVPADSGPECFRAVRDRIRAEHPKIAWPVEYRTLAADESWLSPAHARDSVTISLHQDVKYPHEPYFRDIEAIFRSFDGRPHWGKMHYRTRENLSPSYRRWSDFTSLRRRLDPAGLFLNPHLRPLFE